MRKCFFFTFLLLGLVGCESGPAADEVAENLVRAKLLGNRAAVIPLLAEEDAKIIQSDPRLSTYYTGREFSHQLAELNDLLASMVVVTTTSIDVVGNEAKVSITVQAPDQYAMLDGMWGTSFVDYLVADDKAKKVVDLRLIEKYSGSAPPMAVDDIVVALRKEKGQWKIVEDYRTFLDKREAEERRSQLYLENLEFRTQIVQPRSMDGGSFLAGFTFVNSGDETISSVDYLGYFLSSDGDRVGDFQVVGGTGDTQAGYEFGGTIFFRESEAPRSWDGRVEVEIGSLRVVSSDEDAQ